VHLTAAVAVAVAAQAADLAVKIIIFGFFYYSSRPAQSRAPLSTKKMVRRVVEQKPRSGLLTISWALLVTDEEQPVSQAVVVLLEGRDGGGAGGPASLLSVSVCGGGECGGP
jgi:hypothetical protein